MRKKLDTFQLLQKLFKEINVFVWFLLVMKLRQARLFGLGTFAFPL